MIGWIRVVGGCMRVEGAVWNSLKGGWNRGEGRENKDFKEGGGQAGSRGGCLKKEGGWNPLTNYNWMQAFHLASNGWLHKNSSWLQWADMISFCCFKLTFSLKSSLIISSFFRFFFDYLKLWSWLIFVW